MVRRRRNKVVLWEWSPSGGHNDAARRGRRRRSIGRDAIGAALLLGVLIFVVSRLPVTTDGYRRDRLATFMCDSIGVEPGTLQCAAAGIGGWFAIVLTIGVVLRVARVLLQAVGVGRDKPTRPQSSA
jgi:hypothetical protein